MDYVFGKIKPGRNACRLKTLQEVDDDYELMKGVSRIKNWPSEAYFKMDENFPDDIKLEDVIFNTNGVLVISSDLKDFLDGKNLKNTEFLPIKIINHKGRIEKDTYYIFSQIQLQDCIDVEESVVRINKIDPDSFMSVRKLVIDQSKIHRDSAIFRMAKYPDLPIFRRDIAEEMQGRGFTGIVFGEIADWKGK